MVYLVQVWRSRCEPGPASVCPRSLSSSPQLCIYRAPPATERLELLLLATVTQAEYCVLLPWQQPSSCGTSPPASWWWFWPRCQAEANILFWPAAAAASSSPPSEQGRWRQAVRALACTGMWSCRVYLYDLLQSRLPLLLRPGVRAGVFPLGGCCSFEGARTQSRTAGGPKHSQKKIPSALLHNHILDCCTSIWKDRLHRKWRPGWK